MKQIYRNFDSKIFRDVWCAYLKVKVEYIGHVRQIIHSSREEELEVSEGASLGDLLLMLSEKYGEPFKKAVYEPGGADLKPNFIITVNGYLLNQLNGIETKLRNGDHVILTSIVSGG
ncbi:MAG: MoaD/ThiS family protein [Candidatus Bathyarchaeia archaeon]